MNAYEIAAQLLPYILSVLITSALFAVLLTRLRIQGTVALLTAGIGELIWITGAIFEIISSGIEYKLFWDNVQFIGTFTAPISLLVFAMYYSNLPPRHPRRLWFTSFGCLVLLSIFCFTDSWHHLIRYNIRIIPYSPFSILAYDITPVFIGLMVFTYFILFAGAGIILLRLVSGHTYYKTQSAYMLAGIMLPAVGALSVFLDITYYGQRDLTPIFFGFGNLFLLWGMIRFKFMNLIPAARERIIDDLGDGVIILNADNRIIECNNAAHLLFSAFDKDIIGKHVSDLYGHCMELERILRDPEMRYIETLFHLEGSLRNYEITIKHLTHEKSGVRGLILIFQDVTRRYKAEEMLRQYNITLEEKIKERTKKIAKKNEELLQEINRREKYEIQLKETLADREILLKEIHHRVKNNLQIIVSLIYLEMHRDISSQGVSLFSDTLARIRTMSMIHERLYSNSNYSHIDFLSFTTQMVQSLKENFGILAQGITVNLSIHECVLDINRAIPVALILNEALTNSFKHAFPDERGGTIKIDFTHNDSGDYVLNISDDGIGISGRIDREHFGTLGMELIYNLTKQINGECSIEGGNGTRLTISFNAKGGINASEAGSLME